jgi:uncharacterized membrane protein YsdA (DUF1294 family)
MRKLARQPEYLPVVVFAPLLVLSFCLGYTPLWVPACFLVVSLMAFVIYYRDKRAAVTGAWRTPESTLHMLALMCGWPGAVIAQQTLRHKTQKKSFRTVFWLTVTINVAAFAWLHTVDGKRLLQATTYSFGNYLTHHADSYVVNRMVRQLTAYHVRN